MSWSLASPISLIPTIIMGSVALLIISSALCTVYGNKSRSHRKPVTIACMSPCKDPSIKSICRRLGHINMSSVYPEKNLRCAGNNNFISSLAAPSAFCSRGNARGRTCTQTDGLMQGRYVHSFTMLNACAITYSQLTCSI